MPLLNYSLFLLCYKGKQYDSADVTFRIVPTTYTNWQARSDFVESLCS